MPEWLQKLLLQLVVVLATLIPTWLFIIFYNALHPTDFWQGLALLGVWAFFLGGIQLFLFVVGIAFSFLIWDKSQRF